MKPPTRRSAVGAALLVAALGFGLLSGATAVAKTYVPTRFDDPAPNGCKLANCSLREAINASNNRPGPDKVKLAAGKYRIQIPPGPLNFDTGDLNVADDLVIAGKGVDQTKVNGKRLDRVFTLASQHATLKNLAVKGGLAATAGGSGGGIRAVVGSVKLTKVLITNNEASDNGGGIWSTAAHLVLKKSTVYLNRAPEAAGLELPPAPTETPFTEIQSSTILTNLATVKAAGILADGAGNGGAAFLPLVVAENSTIAGNVAVSQSPSAEAGGVMADNGATVSLYNSTVAWNRAGDVVQTGVAGGIYQHSGAVFNLRDTVIGQNVVGIGGSVSSSGPAAQCAGAFQGSGGVVVQLQSGTSCSISGTITEPADSKVDLPADNGGPTETVALLPGSAALGFAGQCPAVDQRGITRPPTGCDSGAFEAP